MVRNENERAQALRDIGADVVVGNLLDLNSGHFAAWEQPERFVTELQASFKSLR